MKNQKTMIIFISGFLSGIIILLILLYFSFPGLMLKENQSRYGFELSLKRLETVILEDGWKIPAKHDLQATLLNFGKKDINKVVILEICNPDLAEKILRTDDERFVSNLMPCRIAVYEKSDGNTYYSRMNSGLMSRPMGKITRKQMSKASKNVEDFLDVLK